MKSIHYDTGINARLSGDMASKLIEALLSPIVAQIDPIKFGEHQRVLRIAQNYGENLNQKFKNLKDDALNKIIANYPSHQYVIDRKEARELFERVVEPKTSEIIELYERCYNISRNYNYPRLIVTFIKELAEKNDGKNGAKGESDNERGHEGINAANGADEKTDTRANKRNKRGSKEKDPTPDQAE